MGFLYLQIQIFPNISNMRINKTKYLQIYLNFWHTNTNIGRKYKTMVNFQIFVIVKIITSKKTILETHLM